MGTCDLTSWLAGLAALASVHHRPRARDAMRGRCRRVRLGSYPPRSSLSQSRLLPCPPPLCSCRGQPGGVWTNDCNGHYMIVAPFATQVLLVHQDRRSCSSGPGRRHGPNTAARQNVRRSSVSFESSNALHSQKGRAKIVHVERGAVLRVNLPLCMRLYLGKLNRKYLSIILQFFSSRTLVP